MAKKQATETQETSTALAVVPAVQGLAALSEADYNELTVDEVDEDTGEVNRVPIFNYIEGMPRDWRFDSKNGGFNIGGKKQLGSEIKIQPIAFRFFEGDILGLGAKKWVELYFIEPETKNVAALLLHNYSLPQLEQVVQDLYYEKAKLVDVILTIGQEKVESKAGQKFHVATFSAELADKEETKLLKRYAKLVKLYRRQSTNADCVTSLQMNYYDQYADVAGIDLTGAVEA